MFDKVRVWVVCGDGRLMAGDYFALHIVDDRATSVATLVDA